VPDRQQSETMADRGSELGGKVGRAGRQHLQGLDRLLRPGQASQVW